MTAPSQAGAVACDVVWPDGGLVATRVDIDYADELLREYKWRDCVKTNFLYTAKPAAVPVEALEGFADKASHLLHLIEGFGKAYPTEIFGEVTDEEREWLHATRPGLMDRIAASMGRHVYAKIGEDIQTIREQLTTLIKERSNG